MVSQDCRAGRTELAMSIFGKSYGSAITGELYIKGEKVDLKDPRAAIQHGLAYVTEDRKTNGLILDESIVSTPLWPVFPKSVTGNHQYRP